MTLTTASSTGGPHAEAWHDEIVAAFEARIARPGTSHQVVALALDKEYMRYFDRLLEEMSSADARLPHPHNPDRTLLRSAACEVILGSFVAGREAEGDPAADEAGIEAAMTGDLPDVLLDALLRRTDPDRPDRLVAVELLLLPEAVASLERQLRQLAACLEHEDREWYLDGGFADLRASFVEASIVTWMLLHELVAAEAIPARHTSAILDAQERASRRRRILRLA